MTDYEFHVGCSPFEHFVLKEGDDRLYVHMENTKGIWFVDNEELANSVVHDPTDKFWECVVESDTYSNVLSDYITTGKEKFGLDEYIRVDDFHIPYWPDLPAYERKFCESLTSELIRRKVGDKYQVWDDFPKRRRLVFTGWELGVEDNPPFYLFGDKEEWDNYES